MAASKVFVCLVLFCNIFVKRSEQCLATGNDNGLPSFQDYGNDADSRITLHHQAIIPSYEFTCCGNITEWGVDVQPGGRGDDMKYTLDFQVWRPSPTVGNSGAGQYMLVGNNRFTSISLSGDVVQVTPLARNQVQFRPEDVLGFYVEEAKDANNKGVNVLTTASFSSEIVWYASVTTLLSTMGCPVSAGSSGVLNTELRGAPVISIETETYNCPQITSTPPPCPTATTTSPQPTMPPTVPTDPESIVTTTTEPVTDEPPTTDPVTDTPPSTDPETDAPSPTDPVTDAPPPTDLVTDEPSPTNPETEDSTTSDMVTGNPSLSPTPTEVSTEMDLTTEPASMPNSDDNVVPLTGGGGQGTVIAIVIVVVLLTIVLAILVSLLIAFVVLKKRGEGFTITHANLHFGVSNQLYGQGSNAKDITYDYVDENFSSIKYKSSSERLVINGIDEDNGNYHETVLYHSAGPKTSTLDKPPISDNSEHIYEDDSFYSRLGGADPLYEDPTLSQVPLHYEMPEPVSFSDSGIYVPTEAERKSSMERNASFRPKTYNKLEFFVEESIYWAPASTTSDLYSQLASKKYREIPRKELNILEELGSGEFGQVCKAVWSISGATKELAVKTLRPELPDEEKVRFLQEAAIMGQFSHPNVVKLYGVVTVGEPVMICLELMENGDLRHYLCSIAPSKESAKELKMQFLRCSKQIACGMNYLANKAFVHRDLAARNVLLDNTLDCKIGDFGLARDLVYETYYTPSTKGGKLPVKWMAPEALLYKKYSTDSDVWSYGMVLFEIWSVGKKPFSQLTNSEVIKKVNKGYNQPPPPGCPRAIYKLMVDCWNPVHSKRPSFADIGRSLSTSVDLLLQWVEEDDSISSQVGVLGAPLSEADSLYKDLQNVYADTQ